MIQNKIRGKRLEILNYIKEHIREEGYPPTVREIGSAVKLKSTASVHAHLNALEKAGMIRRDPARPRAIEVCDGNFNAGKTDLVKLPIVGNVLADKSVLAEENITGHYPIPTECIPEGEPSFIMKVHGDSMVDTGILNGDYVIAQCCREADSGDIVVALVGDSDMPGIFCRKEGYIRNGNCRILGRVFATFRVFD